MRYIQAIIEHFPKDVLLSRPLGGLVLWVELNKDVNAYKLYQEAMKYGISFGPGQIFSASGSYRNCLRIGYGTTYNDNIEYGLKVLGGLIKKQMKNSI